MKNLIRFANSISSIGIYIVKKSDRSILYYNQKVKKIHPDIQVGEPCYKYFGQACAKCPLEKGGKQDNLIISYMDAWNGYVEVAADEYLWGEDTPAYIMTIVPQMQGEALKENIAYNKMMECAASMLCEQIAYGNLNQNRYTRFEKEDNPELKHGCFQNLDEHIREITERIHPEDKKAFTEQFGIENMQNNLLAGKEGLLAEFRMREEKGSYRWKSFRVILINNPFDEDILCVFVRRDIHVRKELERHLVKQLSVTNQAIPGGVVILRMDEKLTVVEASQSFLEVLGVTGVENLCYMDYVDSRDRAYMRRQIKENQGDNRELDVVYREVVRGETRWIQSRGNLVSMDQNIPVYLMIRMDVSQLKEAQHKLVQEQSEYREYTEGIIDTLSNLVEFRDIDSGGHIKRTRALTKILLQELNCYRPAYQLSEESIEKISGAAVLHDVGKIAISDVILNKPGKLTEFEYETMKEHTIKGYQILKTLNLKQDEEQLRYCLDISRSHHERWDGKGYPDQLKGNQIPIWSQVVSIVDVYDALVSPRVYKKAYSHEQAMEMILGGECGCFNPELLECLKECEMLLKQEYEE